MKREKQISCLIAAVLAFCISFGGVACIITGFSLSQKEGVAANFYRVPADMVSVLLFCAAISAAAAIAFSFPKGKWILFGALALILGYLWRTGMLEASVEAVLYRITYTYNLAYRCGIVSWSDAFSPDISPDVGLCILAGIPALLTAWTVCRRKNAVWAVLCGFILLGVCFVVTDTVPDVWCLFMLLTGAVLLILTNTVRRQCALDGNRLTALLLVPVILFMSLLFGAVPQEGYESKADSYQQLLVDWFRELAAGSKINTGLTGNSTGAVDLTTVGPKRELFYAVMDVTAAQNGMLYLRGQSRDVYNGESWRISDANSGSDSGWPTENLSEIGTVKITTRSGHALLYFPYYASGSQWPRSSILREGKIDNPFRQREYSFVQKEITGSTGAKLSSQMKEQCLALPHNTMVRAGDQLKKVGDLTGKTEKEIAAAIGRYVSNSARYDLNTDRMPSYESDFAVWFLRESESGYCVHFATAAAVLLRVAGVPARYVSGYVVKGKAGKTVTVTENRAHAWVEYFVPDEGWCVLDPTPASWYTEEEETTAPPQTTEPSTEPSNPVTAPNSRPTEPGTEPTAPSLEPTVPHGNNGNAIQKVDLSWLLPVLKWLGILLGSIALIPAQYILRRRLRSKRMHTGHPNRRTLERWRFVLRVSRILQEKPPENLYELAEKAKFSQHTIMAAERMEFDRYLDHADAVINQKHWFKRWLIRLVWAI